MVMRNYRKTLPPLDCLVFFEAAARHQSFTSCCNELLVSQAAVSKRIKQLEDWIGQPLFLRAGKQLHLTQAGHTLKELSSTSLEFLSTGMKALSITQDQPVSLASNSAVAMFWLSPLLKAFGMSDMSCPTKLVVSDMRQDLLASGSDMLILHGNGREDGWECEILFPDTLVPIIAPSLLEQLSLQDYATLNDIPFNNRPTLLNYGKVGPSWSNWADFSDIHLSDWSVQKCHTYAQSIGDALKGIGMALGNPSILQDELQNGDLMQLGTDEMRTGQSYYVAVSAGRKLNGNVATLRTALLSKDRSTAAMYGSR